MLGYNITIKEQIELLHSILKENKILYNFMKQAENIGLHSYYIGAGCIAQTVWNYQLGNDLMYGISDFDLVYFDDSDLSHEQELNVLEKIKDLFNDDFELDVINEARVHLWYKDHFGFSIEPYTSLETAINTWPTTATSIGAKLENDQLVVYAPFGLSDLFGGIIRANKKQVTKEIYENKSQKWLKLWPSLNYVFW